MWAIGTARRAQFILRGRVVVTCLILVSLPLVTAWSMGLYDQLVSAEISGRLEEASASAISQPALTSSSSLAEFGERHSVYARVLEADGRVLAASDPVHADGRIGRNWWIREVADFFFGPDGPPDLLDYEARELPEPHARPESRIAMTGRADAVRRDTGKMFVFYRAVPLADGRVLYLAAISRRTARALYDLRYQLLKLTLGLMVATLIAGAVWWRRDYQTLSARIDRTLTDNALIAADFAHDLKNPIAAITASAEMLEGGKGLDPGRQLRIAKVISDAAKHLNRSVDAMLDLARIEESLGMTSMEPVDLVVVARKAIADAKQTGGRPIDVTYIGPAGLTIPGQPDRLQDMLHNLVGNAIVFAKANVEVAIAADDAGTIVRVSDDGPGVSKGNRDKIFQRFFTSRPEGVPAGNGLGLSIVRSIAQAHEGDVALEPTGRLGGATFTVTLRT